MNDEEIKKFIRETVRSDIRLFISTFFKDRFRAIESKLKQFDSMINEIYNIPAKNDLFYNN